MEQKKGENREHQIIPEVGVLKKINWHSCSLDIASNNIYKHFSTIWFINYKHVLYYQRIKKFLYIIYQ